MFLRSSTTTFTGNYSGQIQKLKNEIETADSIVIGAGVGEPYTDFGFDKKRLFYTKGDYGLWQCPKACHDKTYDNEEIVRQMIAEQKDMKIPTKLIPKCPVCGAPMIMNLRCDNFFVQDEGWYDASNRYDEFIHRHKNLHILLLELGVGANKPVLRPLRIRNKSKKYTERRCA